CYRCISKVMAAYYAALAFCISDYGCPGLTFCDNNVCCGVTEHGCGSTACCSAGQTCCNGACTGDLCCPTGQVPCGDACVDACIAPYILNPTTCACECPGISCPEGKHQDPTTCQCVCDLLSCNWPYVQDPNTCDCACPEGTATCSYPDPIYNPLCCT